MNTIIQNQFFSGERPLYESRNIQLSRITIRGELPSIVNPLPDSKIANL